MMLNWFKRKKIVQAVEDNKQDIDKVRQRPLHDSENYNDKELSYPTIKYDLDECPFCQSRRIYHLTFCKPFGVLRSFYCENCGFSLGGQKSEKRAIEVWNSLTIDYKKEEKDDE